MPYFVLDPRSYMVIYHAGLVVKGTITLDEVTEIMGLRKYVIEVLEEMGYNFESGQIEEAEEEPEVVEEIDPIEEEHMVDEAVEDSEVQGIGRATEVEPQEEDPNSPSQAQGGTLPQ
ncbi:hypothetical protein [Staphylococcus phage vB_StaM_SA1]|nr:hypothetical protein [Staphylococcus phage vB_StaM_SA1]